MTALLKYDAACLAVAAAKTINEVVEFRNKAEALAAYARMAKNRELEIDAAEIRLRAERRLGEMIAAQKETVGLNAGALRRGTDAEPRDERPTLAEVGVDKKLSARAQKLAAVPFERYESMLCEWRDRISAENERVTLNLLKEGEQAQRRQDFSVRIAEGCTVADLAMLPDGFARTILADPPWHYATRSERGQGRAPSRHYDTERELDAIKALPVARLAAKDCTLYLWAVDWLLPQALEVISAWGFTYIKVGFVWVKEPAEFIGMGHWTRAGAELCLFATKGKPQRLNADVRQVIRAPVRHHSQKPDETHARIERLTEGPYLELYGREVRPGWKVWGNEIPRAEFQPEDEEPVIPRFLGGGAALPWRALADGAAARKDCGMRARPLTEEQKRRVLCLVEQGVSRLAVCERLGLGLSTVKRILSDASGARAQTIPPQTPIARHPS